MAGCVISGAADQHPLRKAAAWKWPAQRGRPLFAALAPEYGGTSVRSRPIYCTCCHMLQVL